MNWFAQFSRRHIITTSVIVIAETLFYRQYAHVGAEFHFWLHGLFGAALGVGAVTLWSIIKRSNSKLSPWEAGVLGHFYSALPDILFVGAGVLHMYWMDIFALHISIHFIPHPVATMLVIFLISLGAYGFARESHYRAASILLGSAVVVLAVSLVLREPVPRNLYQLQSHRNGYGWLCPMWDIVAVNN